MSLGSFVHGKIERERERKRGSIDERRAKAVPAAFIASTDRLSKLSGDEQRDIALTTPPNNNQRPVFGPRETGDGQGNSSGKPDTN